MVINIDEKRFKEGPYCQIINDKLMSCKTPNLTMFKNRLALITIIITVFTITIIIIMT